MNPEKFPKAVSDAAATAADAARERAIPMTRKLGETAWQLAHAYAVVRSLGFADLLSRVGLQRRRSGLWDGSVGFGAGLLVGAGAALLVAPTSGAETRAMLARQVRALFARWQKQPAAAGAPVAGASPGEPRGTNGAKDGVTEPRSGP